MDRKECSRCSVEKELTEFTKDKTQPSGCSRWCKPCKRLSDKRYVTRVGGGKREAYELIEGELFSSPRKKPGRPKKELPTLGRLHIYPKLPTLPGYETEEGKRRFRNNYLKSKYGISVEDYNKMFEDQNGKCLICNNKSEYTLHVDHCHITGKVRALLCNGCNTGIGLLKENIETLNNAINYLKMFSEENVIQESI